MITRLCLPRLTILGGEGEVNQGISDNKRLERSASWPSEVCRRHHRQNDVLLTSGARCSNDGVDFPLKTRPKPAARFVLPQRTWDLGPIVSCINDDIEVELGNFSNC